MGEFGCKKGSSKRGSSGVDQGIDLELAQRRALGLSLEVTWGVA